MLDRFGLALQQCAQAREQVELALEAVRDSLFADVVFWYPGTTEDAFVCTGSVPLSFESAHELHRAMPAWMNARTTDSFGTSSIRRPRRGLPGRAVPR